MIPGSLLPIGDDDSGIRRVHITVALLILVNTGVFVYQILLSDLELALFVHRYGTIPWEITNFSDRPPLIRAPVLVAIFTSMFIHGGLLHLAFNMLFLWIFGDNVEDAMGHLRFLLFYLACGFAAVLTQVMFSPDSLVPIVGASGAISGVLAAYLVLFPRGRIKLLAIIVIIPFVVRVPAVVVICAWAAIQFLSGYAVLDTGEVDAGGTAFFAHIGGFVAGLILVWFFADRDWVRRQNSLRQGY